MVGRLGFYTNCERRIGVSVYGAYTHLSVAASFFYWFIAASIAELASAVPSAGGGMSALPQRCSSLQPQKVVVVV